MRKCLWKPLFLTVFVSLGFKGSSWQVWKRMARPGGIRGQYSRFWKKKNTKKNRREKMEQQVRGIRESTIFYFHWSTSFPALTQTTFGGDDGEWASTWWPQQEETTVSLHPHPSSSETRETPPSPGPFSFEHQRKSTGFCMMPLGFHSPPGRKRKENYNFVQILEQKKKKYFLYINVHLS